MTIDTHPQGSRDIVSRVKAILMTPKTEWPVIAAEPATVADLYKSYILIIAAVPAVMYFIQMSVIGITVPFGGTVRTGVISGITNALMYYIMMLVMIFVVGLIIDALAPTFGGVKNQVQALKASAYSATAASVASIFGIIPALGVLISLIALIYGIYLLYLGLPVTMKAPQDRAVAYTAVVIVCALVVGLLIGVVLSTLTGVSQIAGGGSPFGGTASTDSGTTFDPNSPLGQLEQFASKLEGATKNLESAQNSGDADAQAKAFGNVLGAVLGGAGGNSQSLAPDQLRPLVPERLGGLQRSEISVERNAAFGIQMSEAQATYSDGNRALDLEITDLGGTMGLMALASWASIEQDRQTNTGFERTYRANNRILHEVWDQSSMHGEFSIITSNRFMVKVEGNVPNMDALKAAVAGVDLAALDRLGAAQASAK
jgi:hypothetical protein